MGFEENHSVWNKHYQTQRSRQEIPDENIVRYFHHYFRNLTLEAPVVLDLGCGSGRNLSYIKSFSNRVVGTDFSLEALKGQRDVICSKSESLPFNNNTFDIVVIWGVLHYLPVDLIPVSINEIYRVLKPGGRVFGTLRSDKDTHLAHVLSTGDLSGGAASTYTIDDLYNFFHPFESIKTGHISRQPLGLPFTIAHHMFEAVR